ncbi:hypothetical protein AAEO56_10365 [Flavobacterium sp. DGU11]|uniref:P/Homo B domain-containing protein n=1 Tax=Flavobacterium arundinis TaxID=3139143 RepID=A0ABU9HWX4_9FLAO
MKKCLLFGFLFLLNLSYFLTFSGSTGTISDDRQPNEFALTASGLSSPLSNSYGLVKVCLNLTRKYYSGLTVYHAAPDRTSVNLVSGIGGNGNNFTNTCFSHSAAISINAASPLFSGTFKPQETIANINNGQAGNGIWKLRIT